MQFLVPQFVDVEDKIIGPLTLKQFLILLAGGFIGYILFRLIGSLFLFILAIIPVAGVCLLIAFGTFNGRTFWEIILSGASFFSEPRAFIFNRSSVSTPKVISEPVKQAPQAPTLSPEEKLSRLHKLTYVLDQDIKSESELLKDKFTNLR